ncbi:MAG: hypothetical protein JRI23_15940 [Deltaproteobacteria bacterium]|nr:hypothetical protein [Deltaproteobacteria bacterium]MBW2533256.1 hypothetical protein [Deltaproteobacteria bacterium]
MTTSLLTAAADSPWQLIPVAAGLRAHAGMVVHFAHQHWGRGFASLGLVVGGAATGTVMGGVTGLVASRDCSGDMCALGGLAVGSLIGLGVGTATGTAIDVAVLAYDEPEQEPLRDGATVRFGAVPTSGGIVFGAGGRF